MFGVCLALVAFISTSMAGEVTNVSTQGPNADVVSVSSCTFGVDGRDIVKTYDGSLVRADQDRTVIMSEWNPESDNHCKFRVTADIQEKGSGEYSLKSVEVEMGVDPQRPNRFYRSFTLSSTARTVDANGRNFRAESRVTPLTAGLWDIAPTAVSGWEFYVESNEQGVYRVVGSLASEDCSIEVFYEEKRSGSNSTPNDSVTIIPSEFYGFSETRGHMTGLCADRDDNADNDADPSMCPAGNRNNPLIKRCKV